jgi:hypothetical protein
MAYDEEALARYMLETGKVPQEGEVFFSPAGELYETQSEEGLEAMRAELELLDYEKKKKRLGSKWLSRQRGWEPSMEGAGTIDERRAPRVPEEPPLTLGSVAAHSGAGALRGTIGGMGLNWLGARYGAPVLESLIKSWRHDVSGKRPGDMATRTRGKKKPPSVRPRNPTEAELKAYREGAISREELFGGPTFKKGGLARKKNIDGKATQGKTDPKYF